MQTFQRLPFAVDTSGLSAPVILQSQVAPLFPRTALAVDGYWLLGEDNPQHLDVLGAQPLQRTVTFTVVAGSGYTVAPSVALTGGGGTGMTATAYVNSGVLRFISLNVRGSAYTAAPTVVVSGGDGTGASATAALGIPPVIKSASVVIGGGMNGLLLPYVDTAEQTICVVAKARNVTLSPVSQIVFGNLMNISAPSPGGYGLMNTPPTTGAQTSVRNSGTNQNPTNAPYPAVADGTFLFMAMRFSTYDNGGSPGNRLTMSYGIAGGAYLTTTRTNAQKVASNRPLGLGNAYYSSTSWYADVEIAAAAIVNTAAIDDAALSVIRARMTTDLGLRGITVL